jgi:hypothetical protein
MVTGTLATVMSGVEAVIQGWDAPDEGRLVEETLFGKESLI